MICPKCEGLGREASRYDDPDPGSNHGRMMAQLANILADPCPNCNGTGTVDEEEESGH